MLYALIVLIGMICADGPDESLQETAKLAKLAIIPPRAGIGPVVTVVRVVAVMTIVAIVPVVAIIPVGGVVGIVGVVRAGQGRQRPGGLTGAL